MKKTQKPGGWIGVDLDGTLAHHGEWKGPTHIGAPVEPMLAQVKHWLAKGETVKIVTARVGPQKDVNDAVRAREAIEAWCEKHVGQKLDVTATKDYAMKVLYDDRCVQIEPNTGCVVTLKPNAETLAHHIVSSVLLALIGREGPARFGDAYDRLDADSRYRLKKDLDAVARKVIEART